MFDFLVELLSEEAQKYKENPKAYDIETKQYNAHNPNLFPDTSSRVNYYLGYALRTLAKNSQLSPENKIRISGYNAMSASYLWTALMTVGSVLPTKFDHKSLLNLVAGFKPEAEMGYMWGFSAQSLYETEFKQHASLEEVERFLMGSGTNVESLERHPVIQPPISLQSPRQTQQNYLSNQDQAIEEQKHDDLPRAPTLKREYETKVSTPQPKIEHVPFITYAEKKKEEEAANLKKKLLEQTTLSLWESCGNTQSVVKLTKLQSNLHAGADIDYQEKQGNTALMNAIDAQNDRVAEFLLKRGANPLLVNKFGDTAATFISSTSPVFELLHLKIKEKQQQNESPTVKLSKLLQQEVITMDCQVRNIKQLLNKGADINYQDESGFTALMLAVDRQNDRVAEYLLNQGADPLLPNKDHEVASDFVSRNSPLFIILQGYELLYAVMGNDLSRDKQLLRARVDVNFQGLSGYTALLIAAEQSDALMVHFFIESGADLSITRQDGKGVLALTSDEAVLQLLDNLAQEYMDDSAHDAAQRPSDSSKEKIDFLSNPADSSGRNMGYR